MSDLPRGNGSAKPVSISINLVNGSIFVLAHCTDIGDHSRAADLRSTVRSFGARQIDSRLAHPWPACFTHSRRVIYLIISTYGAPISGRAQFSLIASRPKSSRVKQAVNRDPGKYSSAKGTSVRQIFSSSASGSFRYSHGLMRFTFMFGRARGSLRARSK